MWRIIHGNEKMYVKVIIELIDRSQKNNSKSVKMYCWMMGMNDDGKKMSCFTTLESYEEMKTLHEFSQELRKDKN